MVKKLKDLQNKKGKKGFSMIELIIVIAIMAILVVLIGTQLIPYLEKSRESRDKTTLDTILTAVQTVVADNELTLSKNDTVTNIVGSYSGDFEKYAGLKLSDTPFKSKSADTTSKVEAVTIIVSADGVIEGAKVGSLTVSSKKSSSQSASSSAPSAT